MMTNEQLAIGIDLGTSNSCVGVVRNGRVEIIPDDQGDRLTPSFVGFDECERHIGKAGKIQCSANPDNTVYEIKRLIGRKFDDESVQRIIKQWPFIVVNENNSPKVSVSYLHETKLFTPEEISSMILSKIKELSEDYLGCKITKAVITVPAYFTDSQRQATIDAGTIAGLEVLKIINEPTAAAIAYGEDTNVSKQTNILVYDFGGGTFDVAILKMIRGKYEVKSVRGNSNLGGGDLDKRLADYIMTEFSKKTGLDASNDMKAKAKVREAAEKMKIYLSTALKHNISIDRLFQDRDFELTISRNCFEIMCSDLFEETMTCVDEALSDSGMTVADIHDVVLVGGSSRVPYLDRKLKEKFPGKKIKRTINPAEAVAYGAAVQAAMLIGDSSVEEITLSDVTPQSLGIFVRGDIMSQIIKRNTPIPATHSRDYTTVSDLQERIHVQVYEGENKVASSNHLLGDFHAEDIEIARAGVPSIKITFDIDCNGILNATAVDKKTGGGGQIRLSVNKGRLLKEDIERMVTEAQEIKQYEHQNRESVSAFAQLTALIIRKKDILERQKHVREISQQGYKEISHICEEMERWVEDHNDATKDEIDEKQYEFDQSFTSLLSGLSI